MPQSYKIPTPTASKNKIQNKFFLKQASLTSREVYDFYKEHRKKVSKTINQYNYFVKAVEGIFNVIQNMVIENESGVYIQDLGYFCGQVKKAERGNNFSKSLLKKYTRSNKNKLAFYPDPAFEGWTMDRTAERFISVLIRQSKIKYQPNIQLWQSTREAYKSLSAERSLKTRKGNDADRIY